MHRPSRINGNRIANSLDKTQCIQTHTPMIDRSDATSTSLDEIDPLTLEGIVSIHQASIRAGRISVEGCGAKILEIDDRSLVHSIESRLATAFRVHSTRPQSDDSAIAKSKLGFGRLDPSPLPTPTHSLDPDQRRIDHPRRPIEIVEHQVLNHINIVSAFTGRLETIHFDALKEFVMPIGDPPRRVVPFDMAHLQNAFCGICRRDERLAFHDIFGKRLLDKNVEAMIYQTNGYYVMCMGRHRDDRNINIPYKGIEVACSLAAKFGGEGLSSTVMSVECPR